MRRLLPYTFGLLACEFVPPMGTGTSVTLGKDTDSSTSEAMSASDDAVVTTSMDATGSSTTPGSDGMSMPDDSGDDTSGCPVGTLGCPCDADTCDEGLKCRRGECVLETCGNGSRDEGEACDDANRDAQDGCEIDCSVSPGASKVVTGANHTCALLWTGGVRCWGNGTDGRLGHGSTASIGDDEVPWSVGNVPVGGTAIDISAGSNFTCALLDDQSVRCWGDGAAGRLGNGQTADYGDDAKAEDSPLVELGRPAVQITSGGMHSCALLDNQLVVCWGSGAQGRLGYGDNQNVGDNEPANAKGTVPIGGTVAEIAAGTAHTCARLTNGNVRCWGEAASGRLGYGNTDDIGDNEPASQPGDVEIGIPVTRIATGGAHTCALLMTGHVRCWGANGSGQLGDGTTQAKGDNPNTTPDNLEDLDLDDELAIDISAGELHTCALLQSGNVKCWGEGESGRLGYGSVTDASSPPASPVIVSSTQSLLSVSAASTHTCARLDEGNLRCWGSGIAGQLGYGNTDTIGDRPGETPETAGDVPFLP